MRKTAAAVAGVLLRPAASPPPATSGPYSAPLQESSGRAHQHHHSSAVARNLAATCPPPETASEEQTILLGDLGLAAKAPFLSEASADEPPAARGKVGLAKVLLGCGQEKDSYVHEKTLQAAVIQLAPSHLSPCRSPACCWRWAAQTLVEEYETVTRVSQGLRSMLGDELGQSAQQQLLDLRAKYDSLLVKWRRTTAEMASLRERHAALECERRGLVTTRTEAMEALKQVEREHRASAVVTAARTMSLEANLAEAQRRPGAQDLEQRLEEEMAKAEKLAQSGEEAQQELMKVKIQRTELEWKIQQGLIRMAGMKRARWRQLRLTKLRKKTLEERYKRMWTRSG